MDQKLLIRYGIDLIIIIILIISMTCRITDNTIHELTGIAMFALLTFHLVLNRRWYQTILKGRFGIQS